MVSLWRRELVRFLRQPSRIVGLLSAPFLFWLVLGSGLGTSFRPDAAAESAPGFLQYFFPGSIVMVVLFTSIFSNMSTIEDRRDGYLMSMLASPMPRLSIVLGKILGGTTQAMIPGMLFVFLAPIAGVPLTVQSVGEAAFVLFLTSFSLNGLGLVIAWQMESTQGFHAVLNLVLMPLWMLSGAVFPMIGASGWVQWMMAANPLAYEVYALRSALLPATPVLQHPFAVSGALATEITVGFSLLILIACVSFCGRPSEKNYT
jgi:ABC-2 type transport system permease protein